MVSPSEQACRRSQSPFSERYSPKPVCRLLNGTRETREMTIRIESPAEDLQLPTASIAESPAPASAPVLPPWAPRALLVFAVIAVAVTVVLVKG